MSTYIKPIGILDDAGSYREMPVGIPVARLVGVINDFSRPPINGLATGTTKIYTTPSQIVLCGILPWLVGVAGSGTVASYSMGTGSGTTDLVSVVALTGLATANEISETLGWGVWKVVPANTDINLAITTAAAGGFTQYDLVPLLMGFHLDRANP